MATIPVLACIPQGNCLLIISFSADWNEEETEAAGGSEATKHLWEESWDDDDTSDDFSAQLKYVTKHSLPWETVPPLL